MPKKVFAKKALNWFSNLKRSERVLISIVLVLVISYVLARPVVGVFDYVDANKRLINIRRAQLNQAIEYVRKYQLLNDRLQSIQTTFRELQLTSQQVYEEVDRIVKNSVATATYNLKKAGTAEPLGTEFQRQDFSLKIDSITLDQLVTLLYELERGKTPLFLGKVDIGKSSTKIGEYQVTLELTSVGKQQVGSSAEAPTPA